jgi:hypothetical protein
MSPRSESLIQERKKLGLKKERNPVYKKRKNAMELSRGEEDDDHHCYVASA